MPDFNTPPFILAAVKRLYPYMPDLAGADAWASLQPQVDSYIGTLEAQPDAYLTSTQLYGLLAQHEPARLRIAEELAIQAFISASIATQMEQIAAQLGIDPANVEGLTAAAYARLDWEVDPDTIPAPDEVLKDVSMGAGGIEGAISVKFKNMKLDLTGFAEIASGFVLAGGGILAAPIQPVAIPIFVIGIILKTVATLRKEMTNEISSQEASVFWGMIKAVGTMHGAGISEATLLATTNAERAKYGLEVLTDTQFRRSLTKLERIKSIKKTDDSYYIIESYRVEE